MLNQLAHRIAQQVMSAHEYYRVQIHQISDVSVIDCGCNALGGFEIGLELSRIAMGTLCSIDLLPGSREGGGLPSIKIHTDWPTRACLSSQYAGWPLNHDGYFAMVSGPIRILRQKEDVIKRLSTPETSECAVAVLESSSLPSSSVIDHIVDTVQLDRDKIILLVAPTTSIAGMIQVVSRSVETCLHKLDHLGFDTNCIVSAIGSAPLPPISADVMKSIGRSNDAILYGGDVMLFVDTDDQIIESIGVRVPSSTSLLYGKPFVEILKEAGDFYSIDPSLFSSAAVTFSNLKTGRLFRYGKTDFPLLTQLLSQS